jgi:hypothetical protein
MGTLRQDPIVRIRKSPQPPFTKGEIKGDFHPYQCGGLGLQLTRQQSSKGPGLTRSRYSRRRRLVLE